VTGSEGALLRRTRLRLIAWSAGSTLAVLLVLGIAIYVAAASSLAASGIAQLNARAAEMASVATTGAIVSSSTAVGVTSDPGQPGVLIGGPSSGTIGFVVATGPGYPTSLPGLVPGFVPGLVPPPFGGAGMEVGPGGGVGTIGGVSTIVGSPALLQDEDLVRAAVSEGLVIRETVLGSAPVRVLAKSIPAGDQQLVALVIGDRTAEVDALRTLLLVLLAGGLVVLVASVGLGYVYAGRALVPIRDSLARQREFAADASHELRTPLAITRAAIADLRRGRDDPASVDRALDDMDAGATRLERLVDDLLLLARTDAEQVELVETDTDLALAVAETVEAMEAVAIAGGVRLVLDIEPAPVRGDEARLRQLAGILVDNAIRHSPAGGRVTVTVRPGAVLTVEDDGPGIDPSHLEDVFERFWRAPGEPAGGTGLGLAIARWIAERHGGTIEAANRTESTGARFTARVPGA